MAEADFDAEQIAQDGRDRRDPKACFCPLMAWAISMLPIAVSVGNKLKRWKTKPMRCFRSRVRSASLRAAKSTPSMMSRPLVARVSPPSR